MCQKLGGTKCKKFDIIKVGRDVPKIQYFFKVRKAQKGAKIMKKQNQNQNQNQTKNVTKTVTFMKAEIFSADFYRMRIRSSVVDIPVEGLFDEDVFKAVKEYHSDAIRVGKIYGFYDKTVKMSLETFLALAVEIDSRTAGRGMITRNIKATSAECLFFNEETAQLEKRTVTAGGKKSAEWFKKALSALKVLSLHEEQKLVAVTQRDFIKYGTVSVDSVTESEYTERTRNVDSDGDDR